MLTKRIEAHKGPVTAMYQRDTQSQQKLMTGGADGTIRIWDEHLQELRAIDLQERIQNLNSYKIRSICDYGGKKFAVGTRASEIVQIVGQDSAECVVEGHYSGELWGLAVHPEINEFVTVGEDSIVSKWNVVQRKMVKSV